MIVKDVLHWGQVLVSRTEVAPPVSHIEIETSTGCNLSCTMCRMMDRTEICKGLTLPYEDAVAVFEAIGAPRVTLSHNGEPLVNPDIFRIVDYVHRRGSWTSLTTNLNVLPGRPADVVASGLDLLKVSIDAATRETYGRIRRGGDFDRVLETMHAIQNEKRRSSATRPSLRLGFVIQEQNYHEVDRFVTVAADLGVGAIRYYLVRPMTDAQVPISFDLPLLSEKLRAARVLASRNGIRTNLDAIPIEAFEVYSLITRSNWRSFARLHKEKEGQQGRERLCLQPWLAGNVLIDGTVSPCCQLAPPDTSRVELGNIRHQSWEHIWNGEAYRTFRRSVRAGHSLPCINECREVRTAASLFTFLRKLLPSALQQRG